MSKIAVSKKTIIMAITFAVWILAVLTYAAFYITRHLAQRGLEGYETSWDWQLLFFSVEHLPLFIIVIAAVLLAEFKFLKA